MQAKNGKKPDVSYRVRKLERKLKALDHTIPDYDAQRSRMERELRLIKGDGVQHVATSIVPLNGANRTPTKQSKSSRMSPNRNRRKRTRSSSSKSTTPILPKNPSIPSIITKDPVTAIGGIRTFCKQCLKYIQQADRMMDTLFVTTNSLNETGVLQKIIKDKGKNLSTGDLTNILMALMSSPAGGDLLKRMGSNQDEEEQQPPANP